MYDTKLWTYMRRGVVVSQQVLDDSNHQGEARAKEGT